MASTRIEETTGTPVAEQTLGELVATATRDVSVLIHKEIELAKAELSATAAKAGTGIGLLSAAGLFGFFTVLLASFAGAFGFSDGLDIPLWAGFLCMAGVYVVLTAIFLATGVGRLKHLQGPERAKAAAAETVAWVKHPRRAS
ncbi:MAG TPA: phage holin family protein [Mycobacteriales bacterium]|nr:phage holin family protein [Mycobacteriales bacterium]